MVHKKRASVKSGEQKVKSLRSLRRLLKRHKVDTSTWGLGQSNSVEKLMQEIREGETRLFVVRGRLLRHTRHAQAYVFCERDGMLFLLYEDRRVFGGDFIVPGRAGRPAVSEKVMRAESLNKAMVRGLQEELGIRSYAGEGMWKSSEKPARREYESSASYPGLAGVRFEFSFLVLLPQKYFNYDGYVEAQRRKVTYFKWSTTGVDELIAALSGEFPVLARGRRTA